MVFRPSQHMLPRLWLFSLCGVFCMGYGSSAYLARATLSVALQHELRRLWVWSQSGNILRGS